MGTIRVWEFGVMSYWPKTIEHAIDVAKEVMKRNGAGMIQQRQPSGLWKTTHRYEPWTGVVEA